MGWTASGETFKKNHQGQDQLEESAEAQGVRLGAAEVRIALISIDAMAASHNVEEFQAEHTRQ